MSRRRYVRAVAALFVSGLALVLWGCPRPCEDATTQAVAACASDPSSQACRDAKEAAATACAATPAHPPAPNPTPSPVPQPPAASHEPQCSSVEAGLHARCWHDPDGQGWRWRGADGRDYQRPEDEPQAPPAPPAPQPPSSSCLPDQAAWLQSTSSGEMAPQVQAALDIYRRERPEAFEDGGARLAVHSPAAVDALYDALGAVLARTGVCGGQTRNGGERGDKLGLLRGDGQVEAFHLVEYGGFRLQSPIRTESVWRAPAAAPAPPAGPAATCGEPVPPGVGRIKVKVHNVGPAWTTVDSEVLVHDAAYCASAGFTDGRLYCPFRPEGHPQRAACESLFPVRWSGPGEPYPDNPAMWHVPRGEAGTVTVCAQDECASVEVQP